eukprot:1159240-Pelagomonas_calceolata.AAC.3
MLEARGYGFTRIGSYAGLGAAVRVLTREIRTLSEYTRLLGTILGREGGRWERPPRGTQPPPSSPPFHPKAISMMLI